jgi:EmrB/QacA subfamily drug resistance transporter
MMAPVGLAMLFRVFPPAERLRAASILTVPTTLAPALGPIVGGVLVTELSWRWVFYVNVPLGILAVGFGALFLAGGNALQPGPFDVFGFLLAGASLGLLMYGASEGAIRHWNSPVVLTACAAGAVLLAVLVLVELRKRLPLIDLRLFGNRLFRSANGVMVLSSASFIGTLFVVSLFFQDGRGLSALGSGLSTFPEALGVMAGAQLASRWLYPVLGPRRNIAFGLVGVTVSIGLMSLVGAQTNLWWMRLLMFSLGVTMGQVFVPAQAAAFATISGEATGRGSTVFNVIRQLGSALGVALFTTVIVAVGATTITAGRAAPNLTAYHAAFLAAAAVAAVGALVALTIHDADAAATIVRRGSQRAGPAVAAAPSAAASPAGGAPAAGGPPVPRPG